MIEALGTDPAMWVILWWAIGVSVTVLTAFSIALFNKFKNVWYINMSIGWAIALGLVAFILWGTFLISSSAGDYDSYRVSGVITDIVGNEVAIEGVEKPINLGSAAGLLDSGDVLSAECKDAGHQFNCDEMEKVD